MNDQRPEGFEADLDRTAAVVQVRSLHTNLDPRARAQELSRRIKVAIERAGLNISLVDGSHGITKEAYRKLESGVTNDPAFFRLMATAAMCRVSPWWLAQYTDDPDDYTPPQF